MICFTVWKSEDQYRGFECTGHAGYDDSGRDIICSAVSALAVNTVNSIEEFTQDAMEVEQEPEGGFLRAVFPQMPGMQASLLMDSLVLGIQSIQAEYGNAYITLLIEEV